MKFNSITNEKLSGSEAIYGFTGWLTARKEKTIMSGSDDASIIADLVDEFNKKQNLKEPRDHWEKELIPMTEKTNNNMKNLMTFESYAILGRVETVTISNDQGQSVTKDAKIDTGSYSSRISTEIAKELQLPIIDKKTITSAMGEEDRVFVELQFNIAGVEIKTIAGIVDTEDLRNEVAIGRKDIEMVDGLVDVKKDAPKDNEAIEDIPEEVAVVEPTLQAVEVEVELPINSLEDAETTIQSFESFNNVNN